jgi:hypothetical protein
MVILDPLDVCLSPSFFLLGCHQSSSGSQGAFIIPTGRSCLVASDRFVDCCVNRIERQSLMIAELSTACMASREANSTRLSFFCLAHCSISWAMRLDATTCLHSWLSRKSGCAAAALDQRPDDHAISLI